MCGGGGDGPRFFVSRKRPGDADVVGTDSML